MRPDNAIRVEPYHKRVRTGNYFAAVKVFVSSIVALPLFNSATNFTEDRRLCLEAVRSISTCSGCPDDSNYKPLCSEEHSFLLVALFMAVGALDMEAASLLPGVSSVYVSDHDRSYHGANPRGYGYSRFRVGGHGGQNRPPHRGRKRPRPDYQNPVPNLAQLRRDNKRKTRKYFRGFFNNGPGYTPRTVPPAPDNTNSFLMSASGISPGPEGRFHAVTPNPFRPGYAWKNSYGTMDKEAAELGVAAGIDFYGSNFGLITKQETADEDDRDYSETDPEDTHGFALHVDEELEALPPLLKLRFQEQEAELAELREENLNLRERLFLLEQELAQRREPTEQQVGEPGALVEDDNESPSSSNS